jgi:DNA-binding protein YbaB
MFGNISKILEMKKKAEELKSSVASMKVSKEYLGIQVVLTGLNKVDKISFAEDFFTNKSKTEIEEQLNLAIHAAQEELSEKLKAQFAEISGGLDLGF